MQDNKAMLKPEFPVSGNSEDEKVYQENLKSYNAWKSTQPKIEDDKKLAKKLRAEIPDKAGNKPQIDFGDYVEIEQKRHGVKNEMYVYKVIGLVHSNAYVDVPVQCPATETLHGQITECVACICCGVQETEVRKYSLRDVKTIKRSPSPVQGMDEKDLIIYGLEEGAENWKAEYDNCRTILEFLVKLKEWKDGNINMDQYVKLKPIAWERAKEFLKKYQHE